MMNSKRILSGFLAVSIMTASVPGHAGMVDWAKKTYRKAKAAVVEKKIKQEAEKTINEAEGNFKKFIKEGNPVLMGLICALGAAVVGLIGYEVVRKGQGKESLFSQFLGFLQLVFGKEKFSTMADNGQEDVEKNTGFGQAAKAAAQTTDAVESALDGAAQVAEGFAQAAEQLAQLSGQTVGKLENIAEDTANRVQQSSAQAAEQKAPSQPQQPALTDGSSTGTNQSAASVEPAAAESRQQASGQEAQPQQQQQAANTNSGAKEKVLSAADRLGNASANLRDKARGVFSKVKDAFKDGKKHGQEGEAQR